MKSIEMRKIVMLAVMLSVLAASMPSAHACSGSQAIQIVSLSGGLSVGYKYVTVTVNIPTSIGNTVLLKLRVYYEGNAAKNEKNLVNQQTVTLTLTVNPNNPNQMTGTVTLAAPLTQGAGYYMYVVKGYTLDGQFLGTAWIDPREGTDG